MNDDELVVVVGALRMRVDLVGDSVSGPSRVRYANVRFVDRIKLQTALHFSYGNSKNRNSVQQNLQRTIRDSSEKGEWQRIPERISENRESGTEVKRETYVLQFHLRVL